jgi:hypothetical protein
MHAANPTTPRQGPETAPRGPHDRIWVPGHPQGGNWRRRAQWFELKREDDVWRNEAIKASWVAQQRTAGAWPYRQCRMTVYFCYNVRRSHDWDNMIGSLKGILDGFKKRVIADDDTDCIVEFTPRIIIGQGDGILFEIEPVLEGLGL